jgi:hypothetical protein
VPSRQVSIDVALPVTEQCWQRINRFPSTSPLHLPDAKICRTVVQRYTVLTSNCAKESLDISAMLD